MTIGSRRRITREALFSVIPEYAGATSKEAAERMFERDKADIIDLGLDLHTEVDAWDESVVHYRIGRTAASLPALDVSRAEYTVLLAASRAWDETAAGGAARRVRAKLLSLGIDADPELERRTPQGSVESLPVLAPLLEAVTHGSAVTFRYRAAAGLPAERRVEPWVVGVHDGHWYILGHDLDREAARLFRASRIESFPRRGGRRTVPVPPDADLATAISGAGGGDVETAEAVLTITPYKALALRDRAGAGVGDPTVRLPGMHRTHVRRLVLAHARWTELVAPADWRSELGEITARIAEHHRGPGDLSPLGTAVLRERAAIRTPSSSTDHLSRLISEAAFVLSRGETTLAEMAGEFGISEKRLIQDLQILFVCGDLGAGWEDLIDVEWEDGWVRVRNADALDTPLRLTPAEATALLAGLAALSPARGEERDLVDSARAKLTALIRGAGATGADAPGADSDGADSDGADAHGTHGPRPGSAALAAAPAAPAGPIAGETRQDRIIAAVQEALVDSTPIAIRYSPPDRPGTSVREIVPERLETSNGRGYLRAHDRSVGAGRTFRVDRIVEVLAPVGDAPDGEPVGDGPEEPTGAAHAPTGEVWLRLEGAAAWIADSFSAQEVRDLPAGGILARLQDPIRSALVDAVMEAGGSAELLAPADIRDEIVTVSEGAAARHGVGVRIN